MDEEIKIINENTRKEKIKKFFIKNKKKLSVFLIGIVIFLISYFLFLEIKSRNHAKVAEKFNNLTNNYEISEGNIKLKDDLIQLINSKNTTYSPLALYFIIENNLIKEKTDINKYFDQITNIKSLDNEIKNLNIYKKALFNADFANENELLNILKPVINSESIWKSHSLLLLSEYFYFKNNKEESKNLLNEILNDDNSNQTIKLEAQKKLTRDFSD